MPQTSLAEITHFISGKHLMTSPGPYAAANKHVQSARFAFARGMRWRICLPAIVALPLILHPAILVASTDHPATSGPAKATPFTKDVSTSGWIPFEFFRNTRIFIPAEINGVPAHVMLDSGASQTVIDNRFSNKLRIKGAGNFSGQGAGGSAAYTVLNGVNIKIGAITFHNADAVGIDLRAVEQQVGHDLPVALGGAAFTKCIVDIDFVRHLVAFRDPATFIAPSGAQSLAVAKAGENFAIQATVEGRPASLEFDIGDASPLNLYAKFWNKPGFLAARPTSTLKSGGLGGVQVNRLATIKNIDVAGQSFTNIPTVLENEQKDAPTDGIIGMPTLRRFRLLVDFPQNRILFAAPIDTKTSFDANHTGLTLSPTTAGEKVLYVAPHSPAEIAGIKAGDLIQTIDGVQIKEFESRAGLLRWIYGAPGKKIQVGLQGGELRSLTFAKYF